jgi:hypothetical protein
MLRRFLCLGKVRPLQLLKGLEQFIQLVMVLLIELADGFMLTHDASNTLRLLSDFKLQMTGHAGLQHFIELLTIRHKEHPECPFQGGSVALYMVTCEPLTYEGLGQTMKALAPLSVTPTRECPYSAFQ